MPRNRRPGLLSLQALQLARMGVLAPSRHNTQPWRIGIEDDTIRVYPDFARSLPVADPLHRSLYVSLGCFSENVTIAGKHYGLAADIEAFDGQDDSVVIRFRPGKSNSSTEQLSGLALRQCSRHPFTRERIFPCDLQKLTTTAKQAGVNTGLVTQPKAIERIAELMRAMKKGRKRTAPLAELAHWTRFSASEAESKRDGLLFSEIGYPSMPRCLGVPLMNALVGAHRQTGLSASYVRTSPALMFFAPESDNKFDWFNVGRSFQRAMLTAASLRIRYGHLQLPYSLPVPPEKLADCLGCNGHAPLVVVRLGYSRLASHSLRRSVCQLLVNF